MAAVPEAARSLLDKLQHAGSARRISHECPVFNLAMHVGDKLEHLQNYYSICCAASELLVTTSCFTSWKDGGMSNAHGKVIPAVPQDSGEAVTVFFFDDNLTMQSISPVGRPGARGICNLRHIVTGEFVDFSEGSNGFVRTSEYRHTSVYCSPDYRNVLVHANIMDAMGSSNYISDIIERYADPGGKIIVFMDVNGTILWSDGTMGLDPESLLLSTLCGFTEVKPRTILDFVWREQPTVRLDQTRTLKDFIYDVCHGDETLTKTVWMRTNFESLIKELGAKADLSWKNGGDVTPAKFFDIHLKYMTEMLVHQDSLGCGVIPSWFECLKRWRGAGHVFVLNSFGLDTHAVLSRSVPDIRKELHLTISYELWSDRDASKFAEQYKMI